MLDLIQNSINMFVFSSFKKGEKAVFLSRSAEYFFYQKVQSTRQELYHMAPCISLYSPSFVLYPEN